MRSAQANLPLRFTQLEAQAGVRASTPDRVPFVAPVPNRPNAYCFNGFGSKGSLTIPTYAELLCDHCLQQKPLPHALTRWLLPN